MILELLHIVPAHAADADAGVVQPAVGRRCAKRGGQDERCGQTGGRSRAEKLAARKRRPAGNGGCRRMTRGAVCFHDDSIALLTGISSRFTGGTPRLAQPEIRLHASRMFLPKENIGDGKILVAALDWPKIPPFIRSIISKTTFL